MLTTVHEPEIVDSHSIDYQTKEYVKKPDAVLDYNFNMRLIDKSDAMISSVECARKNLKWYRKLFFHLLDMTTQRSHFASRGHRQERNVRGFYPAAVP
ncbi:PiggyBac transposable element-derived protein 4 [Portunus trituberculatus]|uniref:PiggyBac transposable element-derived protein 4 n=1 Tax=Portunus trituberculatus TaxID=210409 RepID=A0A5B7KMP4_PORTR|nr:PiggyBac transposable element-derived protein 4 [Portunus trituberculatus]